MISTINSDLANGIGNLLSRTLTMIERYTDGNIPVPGPPALAELEAHIARVAAQLPATLERGFLALTFRDNLQAIGELVRLCDEYIDKTAPWKLAKNPDDAPKLKTVLHTAVRALRLLAVSFYPFIPQAATQLIRQLGLPLDLTTPLSPAAYQWDAPLADIPIAKGPGLFPRIAPPTTVDTPVRGQSRTNSIPKGATPVSDVPPAPQPTVPAPATTPTVSDQITIDEFVKIQLKTAKILSAERVPKSSKLLKLQVSLGAEQRQIVAGIGKTYEPESLIGKTIIIVANLKPAKLMGIESQGMVLAAGDTDVRGLATILEDVDPGTKVK